MRKSLLLVFCGLFLPYAFCMEPGDEKPPAAPHKKRMKTSGGEKENVRREGHPLYRKALRDTLKQSPARMGVLADKSPGTRAGGNMAAFDAALARIEGGEATLKGLRKKMKRIHHLALGDHSSMDPSDERYVGLGDKIARAGLFLLSSPAASATPGSYEFWKALSSVAKKDEDFTRLRELSGRILNSPERSHEVSSPFARSLARRFNLQHVVESDKSGGGHFAPDEYDAFKEKVLDRFDDVTPLETEEGILFNSKSIFPRFTDKRRLVEALAAQQQDDKSIAMREELNKKGLVGTRYLYNLGYPFKVETLEARMPKYGTETTTFFPILSYRKWEPGKDISFGRMRDIKNERELDELRFSSDEIVRMAQHALSTKEKNLRYSFANDAGENMLIVDIGDQIMPVDTTLTGVYVEIPADKIKLSK